jgi:hypothetical protein
MDTLDRSWTCGYRTLGGMLVRAPYLVIGVRSELTIVLAPHRSGCNRVTVY